MIFYKGNGSKLKTLSQLNVKGKIQGSFAFISSKGYLREVPVKSPLSLAERALTSQNNEAQFRDQTDGIFVGQLWGKNLRSYMEDLLDFHLEYSALTVSRLVTESKRPPEKSHSCPNAYTQFFGDPQKAGPKTRSRRILAASDHAMGIVTSNSIGGIIEEFNGYSWEHEAFFSRVERAYANRMRSSLDDAFTKKTAKMVSISESVLRFGPRADIAFFIAMQTMRDRRLYAEKIGKTPLRSGKLFVSTFIEIAIDVYTRTWCLWNRGYGLCFGEQPLARYELKHSGEGFFIPLSRWTLLDISPSHFSRETHTLIQHPEISSEGMFIASERAYAFYVARLIDKVALKKESLFCHPEDWESLEVIFSMSNSAGNYDFKKVVEKPKPLNAYVKPMPTVEWSYFSYSEPTRSPAPRFDVIVRGNDQFQSDNLYWVELHDLAEADRSTRIEVSVGD